MAAPTSNRIEPGLSAMILRVLVNQEVRVIIIGGLAGAF